MLLFIHWLGCCWFFIVKQNQNWIPPLDSYTGGDNVYNKGNYYQYFEMLYYALLIFGGNDISPNGLFQIAFIIIMLIFCSIANAIILGNITVMLTSLNRKSSRFQEKLENVTDVMKNLKLNENLEKDIKHYISYIENTYENQKEMDTFLSILSPSLKRKVIFNIFKDTLLSNKMFEDQNDIVSVVWEKLETRLFMPEDVIIAQGAEANSMFFIASGVMDIYVTDENYKTSEVKSISTGNYFGEVALLKEWRRTATVISKTYSTCAELEKSELFKVLTRYPFLKTSMENYIKNTYKDRWKKFIFRALNNIDYFGSCIPSYINEEIGYLLEIVSFNKGEYLFKANQLWEYIYIISQGEVDITLNKINSEVHIDTLYTGWSIGSYGIISGQCFITSGIAKTDWTVLRLPHSKLIKARKDYDEIDHIISQYESYIELNGPPYWDYKLYRYSKKYKLSCKAKIMNGIRRIWRIIKSLKTYAIQELLSKAHEK